MTFYYIKFNSKWSAISLRKLIEVFLIVVPGFFSIPGETASFHKSVSSTSDFGSQFPSSKLEKDLILDEIESNYQQLKETLPETLPKNQEASDIAFQGLQLLRSNDREQGVQLLEKAWEMNPNLGAVAVVIALTYLQAEQYDKALLTANKIKDMLPSLPAGYIFEGMAYSGLEEREKSKKAFLKALEVRPGEPTASRFLANDAIKMENPDRAKTLYKNVLIIKPNHLKTILQLAILEFNTGDQVQATNLLTDAITEHQKKLLPRLLLANIYLKTGETQKALTTLESALELFPNNIDLHYILARTYASLKNREGYYKELSKVLELNENIVKARSSLVKLLLAEKNTVEAQTHIKILKKQIDDHPSVLIFEGQLAELTGKHQKAIDFYRQAFVKEKINFNLLRLEQSLWKDGKRNEAIKLLETWVDEFPEDLLTLLTLGNRYLAFGREKEAAEIYTKVYKSSPDNVLALNNLAWIYKETEQDRAIEYAEKAYKLAPNSPVVLDTLAIIISKRDTNRAEKLIEQALLISPNNSTFHYHKAIILQDAGKHDQALQILRTLFNKNLQFPEKEQAKKLLEKLTSTRHPK